MFNTIIAFRIIYCDLRHSEEKPANIADKIRDSSVRRSRRTANDERRLYVDYSDSIDAPNDRFHDESFTIVRHRLSTKCARALASGALSRFSRTRQLKLPCTLISYVKALSLACEHRAAKLRKI